MALKHIIPRHFFQDPAERREKGSVWTGIWEGRSIRNPTYVDMAWDLVFDAVHIFISPSGMWSPPTEYLREDRKSLQVSRIECDLYEHIERIKALLAREKVQLLSPSAYKYRLQADGFLKQNHVRSMAAYAIYCQDQAFSALLEADAKLSAAAAAYSVMALHAAWGHETNVRRRDSNVLGLDAVAVKERSKLARHAAMKRYEEPNWSRAKQFVLECLVERGGSYKNKAAFIADMRDKLGDDAKSEKTIAKYIKDSGRVVPHWKTR